MSKTELMSTFRRGPTQIASGVKQTKGTCTFNSWIHGYHRIIYLVGLNAFAGPRWMRFQIRKLRSTYFPAFLRSGDRKNAAIILRDLIAETVHHRCVPFHYFHYAMYDRGFTLIRMRQYLPETVLYYRILPIINNNHMLLDDKIIADGLLRAHQAPCPRLAVIRRDNRWYDALYRPIDFDVFQSILDDYAEKGFVIKPAVLASGGRDVRAVRRVEASAWSDQFGPLDLAELFHTPGPDLILQEKERNGGSLAPLRHNVFECFRVLTVLDSTGAHAIYVTLKLSCGDAAVDNGHAGGIYLAVDIETGQLSTIGYDERGDQHYRDTTTGTPFDAIRVGEIGEIVSCAEHAAAIFPSLPIVGWDIGLGERGAVVIEGNSSPGLALIQKPHDGAPRLIRHLRAAGHRC